MSCSLSELRAAVSTQILTLSGFHLIKQPPDYFGRVQNTLAHKAFTVDLRSSSEAVERQRKSVGVMLQTTVGIKFSFRLRPKDLYPTDYDNALDAEKDVINKVLNSYQSVQGGLQIRYNRSTRSVPDSMEYMIINLEFTAQHTLPI